MFKYNLKSTKQSFRFAMFFFHHEYGDHNIIVVLTIIV